MQLRMQNMSTLEVDGLQQEKNSLGSTPLSQAQESEATMSTDSDYILQILTFWRVWRHSISLFMTLWTE